MVFTAGNRRARAEDAERAESLTDTPRPRDEVWNEARGLEDGDMPFSARAQFCRESAPPLCARRLNGLACRAAREKPGWVPASPDRVPVVDVGDSDVGAKLTTLQRRVASSRVPWLLLAGLGELRVMRAPSRAERKGLNVDTFPKLDRLRFPSPRGAVRKSYGFAAPAGSVGAREKGRGPAAGSTVAGEPARAGPLR